MAVIDSKKVAGWAKHPLNLQRPIIIPKNDELYYFLYVLAWQYNEIIW